MILLAIGSLRVCGTVVVLTPNSACPFFYSTVFIQVIQVTLYQIRIYLKDTDLSCGGYPPPKRDEFPTL